MVRNFPFATRRRMAAVLAIGSLLVGVAAVPVASADGLKDKKHKVEKHLHSAHQDLEESSDQLRAAAAALHLAQQRLGAARSHLSRTRGQLAGAVVLDHQMQVKLDAAVARLRQARADLTAGRAKIADEEKTLGQIVVQNYQTGDPSLLGLSMVLTSQDPTELTGQLNSVQNVLDKETATLDRLQAAKVLLTVQEEEVEAAKVEVAGRRESAAKNLVNKQRLEARAAAQAAQVRVLVSARLQAKRRAASARGHDLAVMRKLKRQEARISALLKRRAEAARRRAGGASSSLASDGFLSWPLRGPVTSPYGWRINPITHALSLHDGIDIGVGCGTPIHASASGRVLQEYYQTAWGNRLILDLGYHRGVGLAVILNHMSGYAARTGDYVHRGQIVGYSGTTGWSTGCHLHFTVMANGVAVDPMRWL